MGAGEGKRVGWGRERKGKRVGLEEDYNGKGISLF